MSMSATYYFRYVAFLVGISFMLIITILVIKKEKQSVASLMEEG